MKIIKIRFTAFVFFCFALLFGCASKDSLSTDDVPTPSESGEVVEVPVIETEQPNEVNDHELVEKPIPNPSANDEQSAESDLLEDEEDFHAQYDERISIKERSDYRTYVNGKYSGLTYREAELYLLQTNEGKTIHYDGEAFVIQDTRKNMVSTIRKLDGVLPIQFEYTPGSDYALDHPFQPQYFSKDSGFPLLRNFPVIPNIKFGAMHIGKKWEGKSTVAVRPKQDKPYVTVPVYAEYEYAGRTSYLGMPVHKVVARYALRNVSNGNNSGLVRTSGSRSADIFLSIDTQAPVFIRERTNEVFEYADGTRIENKGTLLHFYKYEKNAPYTGGISGPVETPETPPDTGGKIDKIKKEISEQIPKDKNYGVKKTKRGVQIDLKNLRFRPDSPVLLSGEEIKLEQIANILRAYPELRFFVEGHTADVGNPNGQKQLSEQRALAIVDGLVKRGIPASQFIYSGAGATKPIAPNDSDVNRAKNRRVEITIMQ